MKHSSSSSLSVSFNNVVGGDMMRAAARKPGRGQQRRQQRRFFRSIAVSAVAGVSLAVLLVHTTLERSVGITVMMVSGLGAGNPTFLGIVRRRCGQASDLIKDLMLGRDYDDDPYHPLGLVRGGRYGKDLFRPSSPSSVSLVSKKRKQRTNRSYKLHDAKASNTGSHSRRRGGTSTSLFGHAQDVSRTTTIPSIDASTSSSAAARRDQVEDPDHDRSSGIDNSSGRTRTRHYDIDEDSELFILSIAGM